MLSLCWQALSIFFYLSRKPKGVPLYEYFLAITIPLWSGAAYLSIAFGQGVLKQSDHKIYFARYLDWVVTTPLLLLALAFTAMIYVEKKEQNAASDFSILRYLYDTDRFNR